MRSTLVKNSQFYVNGTLFTRQRDRACHKIKFKCPFNGRWELFAIFTNLDDLINYFMKALPESFIGSEVCQPNPFMNFDSIIEKAANTGMAQFNGYGKSYLLYWGDDFKCIKRDTHLTTWISVIQSDALLARYLERVFWL